MAPTPDSVSAQMDNGKVAPNKAQKGVTKPLRASDTFTYKFATLPDFDPDVDVNAANADFVGKSPGLKHMKTLSPHSVPMRQLVVGDIIKFDLSELVKSGATITVRWICRQRHANSDDNRILMGESNDTGLTDGKALQVNDPETAKEEHWGMWAIITVGEGKAQQTYMTADPEGVIGNNT